MNIVSHGTFRKLGPVPAEGASELVLLEFGVSFRIRSEFLEFRVTF